MGRRGSFGIANFCRSETIGRGNLELRLIRADGREMPVDSVSTGLIRRRLSRLGFTSIAKTFKSVSHIELSSVRIAPTTRRRWFIKRALFSNSAADGTTH